MSTKARVAVGLDLGSSTSKQVMGFPVKNSDHTWKTIRIPFSRSPARPGPSHHEVPAVAGLNEEGQPVYGERALGHDINFPLKTVAIYRAVQDVEILKRLPGSWDLFQAVRRKLLDKDIIDEMVRTHLKLLRNSALREAEKRGVEIGTIVLTYPNYLCSNEGENWFEKYMDYIESMVQAVWKDKGSLRFEILSEGQAATQFICQPFTGLVSGVNRQYVTNLFCGMDKQSGKTLVVVDAGSSSLNVQVQLVFFDEHENFANSQSIVVDGLQTGAQGGSDFVNSYIKRSIQGIQVVLASKDSTYKPRPGDIAAYIRDFELKKHNMDWDGDEDLHISLHGKTPSSTIPIGFTRQELKEVWETAFGDSLKVLKATINQMLDFRKDFAILFCGGSVANPGLRRVITKDMEQVQAKASKLGVKVNYDFLCLKDAYWSAAVSTGAAVATMHMPPPMEIFQGSAIGLQVVGRQATCEATCKATCKKSKRTHTNFSWVGWNTAEFLISEGCGRPGYNDQQLPADRENYMLKFVCSPRYAEQGLEGKNREIEIYQDSELLDGPAGTYDLGYTIHAEELSKGIWRVEPCGQLAKDISRGSVRAEDSAKDSMALIVRCYEVDCEGHSLRNPRDKKIRLTLKTDPATKFLIVRSTKEIPFWCHSCDQELTGVGWECADCKGVGFCGDCGMGADHEEHEYGRINASR